MTKQKRREASLTNSPDSFGIATCIYPPEKLKRIVPKFTIDSLPDAPVAAQSHYINHAPVSLSQFSTDEKWQNIIEYALGHNTAIAQNKNDEENELTILIQTIVEHGQKMLPLLQSLKGKAQKNKRLTDLVSFIQSHLNTSINAACLLAPREVEVIEMAAQGATNSEIAHILQIKTITVAKALSRAYHKLDAKNRTEAIHKWLLFRNINSR